MWRVTVNLVYSLTPLDQLHQVPFSMSWLGGSNESISIPHIHHAVHVNRITGQSKALGSKGSSLAPGRKCNESAEKQTDKQIDFGRLLQSGDPGVSTAIPPSRKVMSWVCLRNPGRNRTYSPEVLPIGKTHITQNKRCRHA